MATQNPPVDGSAVSTVSTTPQSMEQGQGGQQQPTKNPGPFLLTPIVYHDKPKERAKWVAVIDLCFGVMWLVTALRFSIVPIQFLFLQHEASARGHDTTELNFLIAFFLIATILAGVEAITAYGLLKATRRGTAPKIAYRKAKLWRGWSMIFLFYSLNFGYLCISSGLRLGAASMIGIGIGYILCFFIRLVFICIVNGFILELEGGAFIIPASTIASMEIANYIIQQEQP